MDLTLVQAILAAGLAAMGLAVLRAPRRVPVRVKATASRRPRQA